MNRFLLGVLFGTALGCALGFVAFSAWSESPEKPALAAGEEVVEVPASRAPAELAAVPADTPSSVVTRPAPDDSATVSPERVAAALQRAEIRSADREAGTAVLEGRVLDDGGNGLAGVVVRVDRQLVGYGYAEPDELGGGPPPAPSLDRTVQAAADRYAAQVASLREVVTDADGAFRVEGLPEGEFAAMAFKEGWHIRRAGGGWFVSAPGSVTFEAQRVVELPVRVLSPEGEVAEEAFLRVVAAGTGQPALQPVRWTPEKPAVRLPVGEYSITALAGVRPTHLGVSKDEARLASEEVAVDLFGKESPGELVLKLETQLGIRGRVTTFGVQEISNVRVRLYRLAEGETPDAEQLGSGDEGTSTRPGTEFAFMGLERGRYAVGLARDWSGPVEALRVVEVGSEVVRCDLELPEAEPVEHLVVEVLDMTGAPVRDVEFHMHHRHDGGSSSRYLNPVSYERGRYAFDLSSDLEKGYVAGSEEEYVLRVDHEDYGRLEVRLEPGQLDVRLTFEPPAQLAVFVSGYATSSIAGRGRVALSPLDEEGSPAGGWVSRSLHELSASGEFEFRTVVPGSYRLKLYSLREDSDGGGRLAEVAFADLRLDAGPNLARLNVPSLFRLNVEIAGGVDGAVWLSRPSDESLSLPGYSSYEQIGDERRLTFTDLLGGEYTLSARFGDREHERTITIPAADLTLDPSSW